MARCWYVGYFYKGYLKKLIAAMEIKQELKDVKMWYPYITEIYAKDGKKEFVKVPMFHNYVLFEYEEDSNTYKEILKHTPIINFLKGDNNRPIPIEDFEVEHIKSLECTKSIKDYSHLIGSTVIITNGHFEGFTGKCVSIIKGKFKAKVLVEAYNLVEMTVEINLEDLKSM